MFTELNEYLNIVSPNIKQLISDAFKVFERIDYPAYEDEYVQILMLMDNLDISTTNDSILNTTKNIQNSILSMHEIILNKDVTIQTQTLFINAILDIQEYEDKDALLKLVNLPTDPNDILSELVALVTHVNADILFFDIESVSPAFIFKLNEQLSDKSNNDELPDVPNKQKYIDKLNNLTNILGVSDLDIVALVNSGIDVGFPFKVYGNILSNYLDELPVNKIAQELLAACFISEDGIDSPLKVIADNIDNYISDISIITKVNIEITNILLKIQIKASEYNIQLP